MTLGFRRIVSTAVAMLIAFGSMLVCAPATATAAEGHCKPPAQTVRPDCDHCPQNRAMDCCATSAPQPAPVPQDSQQQQSPRTTATPLVQADASAIAAALDVPGLAHTIRVAPAHGYRSTDLPTLNAVFLI